MPDDDSQHMDVDARCLACSQVIEDIRQFVFDQRQLGNTSLHLSNACEQIMDSWKRPAAGRAIPEAGFACLGSQGSKIWFVDGAACFFHGEPGALLKKMICAMNLDPAAVFICSCENQTALENIIHTHGPAVLVLLGEPAIRLLTGSREPMETLQGQFADCAGVPAMPMYHPKDLLDHPELKRPAWNALQKVMEKMGLRK